MRRFSALARVLRRVLMHLIDSVFVLGKNSRAVPVGGYARILVVRDDVLGDLITTLPAIASLKKSFPDARIDCLVRPGFEALLAGNPDVLAVFTDRALLPRGYDCAIAFAPGFARNRLLKKIGARVRVGWGGTGGACFLTHVYADDRDDRPRHEVVSCLEMAALAGATVRDETMRVFVGQPQTAGDKPYVVIHAGASKGYLRWPAEKYAALAMRLRERFGWQCVFTGSAAERDIEARLRAALHGRDGMTFFFGEPLVRLVALYADAKMYIGNLSGPMHLAAALGKPCAVVSVMKDNRDDARYWAPWGVPFVIANDAAALRGGHPGDYDAESVIRNVSVDTVFDAVCHTEIKRHG